MIETDYTKQLESQIEALEEKLEDNNCENQIFSQIIEDQREELGPLYRTIIGLYNSRGSIGGMGGQEKSEFYINLYKSSIIHLCKFGGCPSF